MRQIALDTETTGLEPKDGHRIIEIACIEIIDRVITEHTFHTMINPEREIEEGAKQVHGYSREMLKDSPIFASICDELIAFVQGAEILIHNAPFDLGFLDSELKYIKRRTFKEETDCSVVDTLEIAREKHKGQPNNLNALSDRYLIDRSHRQLHGALIDANLLAKVYLAMTSGQTNITFSEEFNAQTSDSVIADTVEHLSAEDLIVIKASLEELNRHEKFLQQIKDNNIG